MDICLCLQAKKEREEHTGMGGEKEGGWKGKKEGRKREKKERIKKKKKSQNIQYFIAIDRIYSLAMVST